LGWCRIQEDFVKKLSPFGFTTNQAKVYLSIVQSGSISARKISKVTQLHRQDIYKILPKLERKGLITKTIGKPFKIQAIPLETALYQLVLNEREKSNKKIDALEGNLKDLIDSLKEQPKNEEDARFTLLTTDDSIRNRGNLSFEGLRKEVKLVINLELLLAPLTRLHEFVTLLSERMTKTLLLAVTPEDIETVFKTIEKFQPHESFFTAKHIGRSTRKHYLILDRKEVWIATEQKTESGFPCILWTNDKNIVQVYEEHFDASWNHTGATKIYPMLSVEQQKRGKLILV
jgi:sugar-specific transcriptional regulator TrmB